MQQEFAQAIVFTGHRIDALGRSTPRFPPSAEGNVRSAVRAAVRDVLRKTIRANSEPLLAEVADSPDASSHEERALGQVVGVAGGASGGDVIFHEVCAELGVPTRLVLALPVDAFLAASVADAGEAWVRRFKALLLRLGPEGTTVISPDAGAGDAVWAEANRMMIAMAATLALSQTLIALWDGNDGDGPGGTAAMVRLAKRCGVAQIVTVSMPSVAVAGLWLQE